MTLDSLYLIYLVYFSSISPYRDGDGCVQQVPAACNPIQMLRGLL